MIKVLLEKNEQKLPLFYQQQPIEDLFDEIKEKNTLEEFIISCLLDPSFPNFVSRVEKLITNIMESELRISSKS
jgi:hypothetical protein